MEETLEKLVGNEVIVTTCDKVVYSGHLVDCSNEGGIKLKNVHIEYSPKLTAKQVLSQTPQDEVALPIDHIVEYERIIRWFHPRFPSR